MPGVMSERLVRRLGLAAWATCVALSFIGVALLWRYRHVSSLDIPQAWESTFIAFTYGTVGGFLASRRGRHAIPWTFLAIGLSQSSSVFAVYGAALVRGGSHSEVANLLTWIETWSWAPGFVLIPTLLLQLFPTGRVLSPRWVWLARATIVGLLLAVVGVAFVPQTPANGVPRGYRSPFPTAPWMGIVALVGALVLLVCVVGSVASIVLRYRRSRGEERKQLKLFASAAVATVILFTGGALFPSPTTPLVIRVLTIIATPLIPLAAGIAILRYRLYDIDVVINKAVVFGVLAGFITAVYLGIVIGVGALIGGRNNLLLSVIATAVIAVAFQPVRQRVQRFANRIIYGHRLTPYEVLSEFTDRVAETYATQDVLPRMARAVAEGTSAKEAHVWLRSGAELRAAAAWPTERETDPPPLALTNGAVPELPGVDRAIEVRHQGELLGALTVTKPPGEPLSPAEDKLLRDLAAQAGLVLRNVGLTAELLARLDELTASRQRLVAAQDEERRRLERNLHDGAQQHLVALKMRLDVANRLAERDPEKARAIFAALPAEASEALETLRDLARGIYPPLLAAEGLGAALQAQAAKASVPVKVTASPIGRYPQETEAAVYFCCLEALQNVAKYAHASAATVVLSAQDSRLTFSVSDDGAGFDPATSRPGAGLQNMIDRLEALGGNLQVTSAPGAGTTVTGSLPVDEVAPVV
ncbi:MAG TPA: histidine kinase [Actinomycetota bacterium]|jgi:signal transduction histidine kinase|nr:histidine kinase [Actinomycetota bacterium]